MVTTRNQHQAAEIAELTRANEDLRKRLAASEAEGAKLRAEVAAYKRSMQTLGKYAQLGLAGLMQHLHRMNKVIKQVFKEESSEILRDMSAHVAKYNTKLRDHFEAKDLPALYGHILKQLTA